MEPTWRELPQVAESTRPLIGWFRGFADRHGSSALARVASCSCSSSTMRRRPSAGRGARRARSRPLDVSERGGRAPSDPETPLPDSPVERVHWWIEALRLRLRRSSGRAPRAIPSLRHEVPRERSSCLPNAHRRSAGSRWGSGPIAERGVRCREPPSESRGRDDSHLRARRRRATRSA